MLPSNNILILCVCVWVALCLCVRVSDGFSKVPLWALREQVAAAARFKSPLLSCFSATLRKVIHHCSIQGKLRPKLMCRRGSLVLKALCQAVSGQLSDRKSIVFWQKSDRAFFAENAFWQKAWSVSIWRQPMSANGSTDLPLCIQMLLLGLPCRRMEGQDAPRAEPFHWIYVQVNENQFHWLLWFCQHRNSVFRERAC